MCKIRELGKLPRFVLPLLAVIIGLVVNCCEACAADDVVVQPTVAKALDVLAGESIIVAKAEDEIRGGRPYELAWAFSVIVKEAPNPVACFVKLAHGGSYYGLIGLRHLDPFKYRKELEAFSGRSEVRILTDDSFMDMSAEEFVTDDIEKYGNAMYRQLVFAALPRWEDTVKVPVSIRDRKYSLVGGEK